jgi:hypothetical protein
MTDLLLTHFKDFINPDVSKKLLRERMLAGGRVGGERAEPRGPAHAPLTRPPGPGFRPY